TVAIWPPLPEVLWQIAYALEKQFACFIGVIIGLNYQASRWPVCALVTRQLRTIALITEHSHRVSDAHILLDHHPIDDGAATLTVVAVPKAFICVDGDGPVVILVLRHRTRIGHKVLAGLPKIITTTHEVSRQPIRGNNLFARHRSLSMRSATRPRHCSKNQHGAPHVLARNAAMRYWSRTSFGIGACCSAPFP